MNKNYHFISLSLFAVIIICFFLPFISITCGDTKIATLKGTDLAFGTRVNYRDIDSSTASRNVDPEALALLPFILSIAGLVVSIVYLVSNPAKYKSSFIILCILSSIIFISLLALQFKLKSDIRTESGEVGFSLKLNYEFGYWIALILSLLTALLNLYLVSTRKFEQ